MVLSQEEIQAVEAVNQFIAQNKEELSPKIVWSFIQERYPDMQKLPIILAVNIYEESWKELYGWFLIDTL